MFRPEGMAIPEVTVTRPWGLSSGRWRAQFSAGVLALVFLAGSILCAEHQSKSVTVAVRTKWTSTSLLLEASELIGKGDDEKYWQFVEDWLKTPKASELSDKDCVDLLVENGSAILGKASLPLFHLSLLLRSVSPKVVLYRQLAQESLSTHFEPNLNAPSSDNFFAHGNENNPGAEVDAWSLSKVPGKPLGKCCWVDVGSRAFVDVIELREWLHLHHGSDPGGDVKLHEFDHVYPKSDDGKVVAVLYGSLGTPCFHTFHSYLSEASQQGQVKYVLRPVLPSGCESFADACTGVGAHGAVNLGGYGVELALKNMEYKAIDDSEVRKGGEADEGRAEDDLGQEVKGFIFSTLLERRPDLEGELLTFRDHLLSTGVDETMNAWELKDLGYQASQRIVLAAEPLRLMREINQNLPNLAYSLSRLQVNETIKEEVVANQRNIPAGKNVFAINGALVTPETLDVFSLLEIVETELSVAGKIADVKVPPKYVRKLLQLTEAGDAGMFRLDFRSDHLHYLNNIEQDTMYRRWRANLNEILMPGYPGQMRYIRKNLYHTVYVIDPATPAGLKAVDLMSYYYQNHVPMRFGVIFASSSLLNNIETHGADISAEDIDDEDDVSDLVIRMFLYLEETYEPFLGFAFLNGGKSLTITPDSIVDFIRRCVLEEEVKREYLLASNIFVFQQMNDAVEGGSDADDEPIPVSYVERVFADVLRNAVDCEEDERDFNFIRVAGLKDESKYRDKVFESTMFVYKLGLSHMLPCLLMNGLVYGPNQGQNAAIVAMNEEQARIQEAVYFGRINARTDILKKLLTDSGQPRYNPQIIDTKKDDQKFVTLSQAVARKTADLARLQYLHHPGTEDDLKPITHWICLDLNKKRGIVLLQQALKYLMEESKKGRIGILHNAKFATSSDVQPYSLLTRVVFAAANSPSRRAKVVPFLQKVLTLESLTSESSTKHKSHPPSPPTQQNVVEQVLDISEQMGLQRPYFEQALSNAGYQKELHRRMCEDRDFVAQYLHIKPGTDAVITNGRVLVQKRGQYFVSEDFALLDLTEYERRVKSVEQIIQEIEWTDVEADELTSDFLSTIVMTVSSATATRSRSSDNIRFDALKTDHSAIIRDSESSNLHLDVVIDPLSATGQKLTPLLVLLQEWLQPSIRMILNPVNSLPDLPLKNFYRYVMPSMKESFTDGTLSSGPSGTFSNMPPAKTLTMNLDVPEPWLVEPVVALHDLDNIVLQKLKDERTMSAVYELEALVVTGHCYEKDGEPPRGLQLRLGTKGYPHLVDTIVMANLGYWQLKAAPGVWGLQLAPGRSTDLYTMEGLGEGTNEGSLSKQVVVQDLKGKSVRFAVVKRQGQEDQVLLEPSKADRATVRSRKGRKRGDGKGFLNWASNLMGSNKKSEDGEDSDLAEKTQAIQRRGETINIFSIASGHLYERFTKIMILSVLKNTNRPVKFWFIKNYLSPQFKDVIPHMAKEYGFDYSLITYKWPAWLHKQTEKQRIIWAYKILFLDVIFPLSLKKVIFVDADQIIRTDMGELYDMDIDGKPLAYTPFCENNKDMDGFRFWNQGFWRDHLRGKPYHISALYVVDLVQFRQSAAGDNLRVFYETLSKDPNSLSNLDQDLPNYAQHNVPIFSLAQEWLWCESWCGNATKAQAKTIDLCNNPMTKEPKLQGARRIVAEWPALDEEARQFTAKILGGGGDPESPTPVSGPALESSRHEKDNKGQISENEPQGIEDSKDEEAKAEL